MCKTVLEVYNFIIFNIFHYTQLSYTHVILKTLIGN